MTLALSLLAWVGVAAAFSLLLFGRGRCRRFRVMNRRHHRQMLGRLLDATQDDRRGPSRQWGAL
jgi:hypothetical protein